MLRRLQEFMERRQARSFVENMQAWYQTSVEVSDVMGEALHDSDIAKRDIGNVIDRADQILFSSIWRELQSLLLQAESVANYQ